MSLDTLSRAAGRVLIAGFPGASLPEPLARLAGGGALGGVILFARNLRTDTGQRSTRDLAETIAGIRHQFERCDPIVAIDQEGGRVARLKRPFLELPSMRVLASLEDVALTRRAAQALGAQLRAIGIDVDFAPVVDVDSNPDNPVIGDRSFGRDPDSVIAQASAFATGLLDGGVLPCAKHFPGHGDTDLDSHLALPRVTHDRARLDRVELAPFAKMSTVVPMVMTAHVVFDAIDRDTPATLSRAAIALLRSELGFGGVIVSDDLEMRAIADRYSPARAAVLAIAAGCDALLVCSSVPAALEVREALADEAHADPRFAQRLLEAAARIDGLAAKRPPARVSLEEALDRSGPLEAEIAARLAARVPG